MIADLTPAPAQDRRTQLRLDTVEIGLTAPEKSQRIDLGLALLQCHAMPGICYTRDEIAAWCGCTESAIRHIERRALRKVLIQARRHPVLREFLPPA